MDTAKLHQHCRDMLQYIDDNAVLMQETLIAWSETNSGSMNLGGLNTMFNTLESAYKPFGLPIEAVEAAPYLSIDDNGDEVSHDLGKIFSVTQRPSLANRVLLVGHMDTVFGIDHPFQTVKELKPGVLNGPGVTDMKGGLLVMLYALKAFEQSKYAKELAWQVIVNADEEIGSPGSASFLQQQAKDAKLALVYEPSMTPDGLFAGPRKGSGKFSIVVKGKAAHAGRDFDAGRNAICYLAELMTDINALNHQKPGLTVNIGYVKGGGALNIVPDTAVAKLDVRLADKREGDWFYQQLNQLISKYNAANDYVVSLYGGFGRPPKPMTERTTHLFQLLSKVAKGLNVNVDWAPSGGCCDGNNLASTGLAVIDTLGVRGGHIHQADEFIICESLTERAKLTALLLVVLAQTAMEGF